MASGKRGNAIWKLLLHVVVHSFDERSQSDAADSSALTLEQEKVLGTSLTPFSFLEREKGDTVIIWNSGQEKGLFFCKPL